MADRKDTRDEDVALLEQARQGSLAAVQALFDRYVHHVLRIIRRRWGFPERRLCDSLDILQDVRLELAALAAPMAALVSTRAFVGWLGTLTRHKLAEARRYYEADRRALTRDVPLQSVPADQLAAVTPHDDSADREALDQFERGLRPAQRTIFRYLRIGLSHAEIAGRLGFSERTVDRFVHNINFSPPAKS